jgi:hypothetical protein
MKSLLPKSILLFVLLGGTVSGLFMYNYVLWFLSKHLGIDRIALGFFFIISIFIVRYGIKTLAIDLSETDDLQQLSLIKISKFFVGGFVGCYVAFCVVGIPMLAIYTGLSKFLF